MEIKFLLLIAFALLQTGDIATTYRVLQQGGREVNPVMSRIFSALGVLPGLLLVKIAVVVLLVYFADVLPLWAMFVMNVFYLGVVVHNWRQLKK